ncbi:MAG: aldo/keto reductase [Akkermansiaceae bacterium]|jgi:alcohol dehydrogenase (NADP+)|nr:aldo/keto reductase [Akkermansiaceae bacterium]MDP4646748.1 aldo/keto reductase [Akkermansiaceae bacterium]MDP4720565.1 aldo/keto reductase [Akkermansiaceae bacterium]MDP4779665.1 aldo/keto reductase [Akkermansiaceae bacterium]MDP4846677.1 aldo/keto reductase [Akkermansiaceae bacterium]
MSRNTLSLRNGDEIPALGLGTWRADKGEVGEAVKNAIAIGYRHIDCAMVYENEKEIGEAFEEIFASGQVQREDVWITSKLWCDKHDPEDVIPALKQTLADLRLDYLDLYLVHWPIALKPGSHFPEKPEDFLTPEEMPLSETWKGMEKALEAGLCRHIGVSNLNPVHLEKIAATTTHPPEVNQVECHPFLNQNELLAVCNKHGVLLTAYSPLGTGKEKDEDTPDIFTDPVLGEIAKSHDVSPAEIALAWAVQRGTNPIPKSINAERLRKNLEAADLVLTDEEMGRIDGLDQGHRFIDGKLWTGEGSPYSLEWLWGKVG